MGDDQVHICKYKSGIHGKGPIAAAANVTHFVDNDWECLMDVAKHTSTLRAVVLYDNTSMSSRCLSATSQTLTGSMLKFKFWIPGRK